MLAETQYAVSDDNELQLFAAVKYHFVHRSHL